MHPQSLHLKKCTGDPVVGLSHVSLNASSPPQRGQGLLWVWVNSKLHPGLEVTHCEAIGRRKFCYYCLPPTAPRGVVSFPRGKRKNAAPDLCSALWRGSCCVRSNCWEIAPAARGVTTGGSTEAPEMAWPTKVSDQPNPAIRQPRLQTSGC